MLALMNQESLNVGSALVWGQGFYTDVTYFTGTDWPTSTKDSGGAFSTPAHSRVPS